jgi:NAD(P)-dependent dehydrogenase (short-subunit alcohol dehydrogenase family)
LGIGRASAHQFAAHKPRALFICDYRPDYLETHAQDLQSLYPDVEVHVRVFDAADEDAVKRIVSEAVEKYGRLDVFFANAGIVGPNKPFWSVDVEEFEKTQRTNVLRSVICTDGPRIQLIDVASS